MGNTYRRPTPPPPTAAAPVPEVNIVWTDEQQLVHKHMGIPQQRNPLMVNSLAGTGKTSSTVYGVNHHMKWANSILVCAFGKDASEQLGAKLTHPGAQARTLHSVGMAALRLMMPLHPVTGKPIMNVNKFKTWNIADEWLASPAGRGALGADRDEESCDNVKDTFIHMLDFIRLNLANPEDIVELSGLCSIYGLRCTTELFDAMPWAIKRCGEMAFKEGIIDYTDMIYWPIILNADLTKFDAVIVDEAQDLSAANMHMALRSLKPGGFFMCIGDPWQSIMLFAGAVCNGWETIRQKIVEYTSVVPTELRLTICQRCATSILDAVNVSYPEIGIKPRANAPLGTVEMISATKFSDMVQPGDAIGCRFNRPLIEMYFPLIRAGKIPYFKGMSEGLAKAMQKIMSALGDMNGFTFENASGFLIKFRNTTVERMERHHADPYKVTDFHEACDCLDAVIEGTPIKNVEGVLVTIERMSNTKPSEHTVLLTSWHRFKGGEATNVFMLDLAGTLPFPGRGEPTAEQIQQERNIHYVALTRAKLHLYVNFPTKPEDGGAVKEKAAVVSDPDEHDLDVSLSLAPEPKPKLYELLRDQAKEPTPTKPPKARKPAPAPIPTPALPPVVEAKKNLAAMLDEISDDEMAELLLMMRERRQKKLEAEQSDKPVVD